jgi:hypothetical protein
LRQESSVFLLDLPEFGFERANEVQARFDAYADYLDRNRGVFPPSALSFALADWHYDFNSHQCPHDTWLESITISEQSESNHTENRHISISLRLLGSFGDGYLELKYKNVLNYSINLSTPLDDAPATKIGHGEWMIDEVRLSKRRLVIHEIRFSAGSHWTIECGDIEYRWIPHGGPTEM